MAKNKQTQTYLKAISKIYEKLAELTRDCWIDNPDNVQKYQKFLFEVLSLAKNNQLWRVRDLLVKLTDAIKAYLKKEIESEAFEIVLSNYQQTIKNYFDAEKLKQKRKTVNSLLETMIKLVKKLIFNL